MGIGITTEWDEQNGVAIHHLTTMDSLVHGDHDVYEFVVPVTDGASDWPITGLYAPRKSESLIVTFHGSLQRSKYVLPRFEWRRSMVDIDAAQLFIADPTLNLSRGLALGWYIGNKLHDVTADLATLVGHIAREGGYSRIVFAGSSGGGFASLAVSRRIADSVAVVFSPQTRVGDYQASAVRQFRLSAFPGEPDYPSIEAKYRNRVDLRQLYASTPDINYVRYVQNTRDTSHFINHYSPFAEMYSVDPESGGNSSDNRLQFFPQRLQPGHEPPSRGRFRDHLLAAHEEFFGIALNNL